jgi:hypothetical protein
MKLFNRKRYFIVFYEGVNSKKSVIGCCTASGNGFISYKEITKQIKSVYADLEELTITGLVRITKKEHKIWNYESKN